MFCASIFFSFTTPLPTKKYHVICREQILDHYVINVPFERRYDYCMIYLYAEERIAPCHQILFLMICYYDKEISLLTKKYHIVCHKQYKIGMRSMPPFEKRFRDYMIHLYTWETKDCFSIKSISSTTMTKEIQPYRVPIWEKIQWL